MPKVPEGSCLGGVTGALAFSLPSTSIQVHNEDTGASKAPAPVTPPKHEPSGTLGITQHKRAWTRTQQMRRRSSKNLKQAPPIDAKCKAEETSAAEPFMHTGDIGLQVVLLSEEEDVKPLRLLRRGSSAPQLSAKTARDILATDANRMTVTSPTRFARSPRP